MVPKLTIEQQSQKLLFNKIVYALNGNYKVYKKSSIEYANFALNNYEKVKNIHPPKASISLFSPLLPFYAFRILRTHITDLFRKKTPAEKTLRQLVKAEKMHKLNKLA